METNGYRLLLPEGTLDYFIISDVKESSTDIVMYILIEKCTTTPIEKCTT